MPSRMVREVCQVNQTGQTLIRTGADLAGSEEIKIEHLAEAIHFRSLDREEWF